MTFNLNKIKKSVEDDDLVNIMDDETIFIPTGLDAVDWVLGGGFVGGKLTELSGENQSGKSYVLLKAMASAQRMGGAAVLLESEDALMKNLIEASGVTYDDVLHYKPGSLVRMYKKIIEYCKVIHGLPEKDKPEFNIIGVDSVAAFGAEDDSSEKVMNMSEQLKKARIHSYYLPLILPWMRKTSTAVIFVNQLRDSQSMYGDQHKTTGGRSIPFYARIRCRFSMGSKKKNANKEVIGTEGTFYCDKNSVAPPHKRVPLSLTWKNGFDKYAGMLDLFIEQGLVDKKGKTYTAGTIELSTNGKSKAEKYLKNNQELYEELKAQLEYTYGSGE